MSHYGIHNLAENADHLVDLLFLLAPTRRRGNETEGCEAGFIWLCVGVNGVVGLAHSPLYDAAPLAPVGHLQLRRSERLLNKIASFLSLLEKGGEEV
jgi:hypothetical protein